MYILIEKQTGKIKSYSDGIIKFNSDIFELKEVTDEELDGHESFYKNGKLEKKKYGQDKEDLKDKIDKAKDLKELKNILKKLI